MKKLFRLDTFIATILGFIAGTLFQIVISDAVTKKPETQFMIPIITAPYDPLVKLYPWQDGSYRPTPEKHIVK